MTVQVWTAIFVVLTFGLYTAIAWWTRASSTREFYVAGKGVSLWPTAWRPRPIG